MIEIIQENCSSKEFYDDLRELVGRYSEEITGSITLKVTNIVRDEEDDIINEFLVYERKVDRLQEDRYISDWSPNNKSEIGSLMKVNPIIEYITNSWYGNYSKYESVNTLGILEDYISELFDDLTIIEVLKAIKIGKELEFIENSWNKKIVGQFEDFNDFKKHFLQTLDVFYSRNPKFRMDW